MDQKRIRPCILAASMLFLGGGYAQVTTPANIPSGVNTDYVGWDNSVTEALQIRHEGDWPIDFSTSNTRRARIYENRFNSINGYPVPLTQNGFLGLSGRPGFFTSGPGPFSRLHLVDQSGNNGLGTYAQQIGWRPWMRNGVTFTGNQDQGYIGQKYAMDEEGEFISDKSDMVIQWSNDVEAESGPDHLRFLFTNELTGQPTTALSGAQSNEGLEGMRLFPVDNININVGIGDFFAGNLATPLLVDEPTERLDVLTGRVRIRQLPTDAVSTSNEYVTVNNNTGVLEHRPLPPAATPGCEWYSEPLPLFREVRSGLGNVGTGSCPDRGWLYTIGQQGTLNSKFNIYFNGNERSAVNSGLNVNLVTRTGVTDEHYGINVNVSPESGQSAANAYGVRALVQNPGVQNSFGTYGLVTKTNSSTMAKVHGSYGHVELSGGANGSEAYGSFSKSRLVGANYTNVFGGSSIAIIDGSSTVGNSFGMDASSSLVGGSTATYSYGVRAISSASSGSSISSISYGVKANGSGGGYQSFGVMAEAGGTQGTKFGVYGKASGAGTNYSVYGDAASGGSVNWAGFFVGAISASGVSFPSDQNLKTEIEELDDAIGLLMELHPKSCSYRRDEYPQMGLPEGLRYGFIAQEVQEAFPQFVTPSHQPEELDSLGNIVSASVDYLALSTADIIPILVGAAQEQQAQVDDIAAAQTTQNTELEELRTRLDQLEQLLAACCSNPTPDAMFQGGINSIPNVNDAEGDRKLRIQPNPFSESTTVYYTLERSGRAQLMANSADGKELRVLKEANLEAGAYQYEWNTADLAAGVYYVTLLVDGQPVVKKAVKVNR